MHRSISKVRPDKHRLVNGNLPPSPVKQTPKSPPTCCSEVAVSTPSVSMTAYASNSAARDTAMCTVHPRPSLSSAFQRCTAPDGPLESKLLIFASYCAKESRALAYSVWPVCVALVSICLAPLSLSAGAICYRGRPRVISLIMSGGGCSCAGCGEERESKGGAGYWKNELHASKIVTPLFLRCTSVMAHKMQRYYTYIPGCFVYKCLTSKRFRESTPVSCIIMYYDVALSALLKEDALRRTRATPAGTLLVGSRVPSGGNNAWKAKSHTLAVLHMPREGSWGGCPFRQHAIKKYRKPLALRLCVLAVVAITRCRADPRSLNERHFDTMS